MNIFVAGATGVIGRPLLRLLASAGHAVTGTTRQPAKIAGIEALGAKGVAVDAFDAEGMGRAVAAARPEVVIHQLTDLPDNLDPAQRDAVLERNARLRIEGTRNLMAAARAAGVHRVVAQSIAFIYAAGQGISAGGSGNFWDWYLVKLAPNGDVIWERGYRGGDRGGRGGDRGGRGVDRGGRGGGGGRGGDRGRNGGGRR